MKIRIYNHNNPNKDIGLIALRLVEFSVPPLFSDMTLDDSYSLNVFLRPEEKMPPGEYGNAFGYSLKKAEITINRNISLIMFCATIFHEMAHVKQMWKDKVVFTENGARIKGRLITYDEYATNTLTPWEIEACGYENTLMEIFRKTFSLSKKEFKLPINEFLGIICDDSRRTFLDGFGKDCAGS